MVAPVRGVVDYGERGWSKILAFLNCCAACLLLSCSGESPEFSTKLPSGLSPQPNGDDSPLPASDGSGESASEQNGLRLSAVYDAQSHRIMATLTNVSPATKSVWIENHVDRTFRVFVRYEGLRYVDLYTSFKPPPYDVSDMRLINAGKMQELASGQGITVELKIPTKYTIYDYDECLRANVALMTEENPTIKIPMSFELVLDPDMEATYRVALEIIYDVPGKFLYPNGVGPPFFAGEVSTPHCWNGVIGPLRLGEVSAVRNDQ